MKEVKLPSGAVLKITVGSFEESKALYQACLEELGSVHFATGEQMMSAYKNIICTGFASKKVEKALWVCLNRVLYNDSRVTLDTFENEKAREDYNHVFIEVLEENVRPFMKSLYAVFLARQEMLASALG